MKVLASGRRNDGSGFTYLDTREQAGVTLFVRQTADRSFGAADFSNDLGVDMVREGMERQYPRARLALACHAASLEPPLDSLYLVDLKDLL